MCTFCSTFLDTWAKERSSHILPRNYRDGRCRQKLLLTKSLQGMRLGVSPMAPKQSDKCSEWVVRKSLRPKKLTFQRSRIKNMLIIFLDSQKLVHNELVPERKTVNAEYYKRVMDRLLKPIQRFRPATFCSRKFFLSHDNAPAHTAASIWQFLTKNTLRTLQIFIRQTVFFSPSSEWS